MSKEAIIRELREILLVYHYKSDTENMSKDVVTSLENLVGTLLKEDKKDYKKLSTYNL
tara:strand:+ start:43 stop:216 length:174 start_codon:yes stop_codon:yes gene_type:complete